MRSPLLIAVLILLQTYSPGRTQNPDSKVLGPSFFAQNRAKVQGLLQAGEAAVFFSGSTLEGGWTGSGVATPFKADPVFYRLTGVNVPNAVLVLLDSTRGFRDYSQSEYFFIPEYKPKVDWGMTGEAGALAKPKNALNTKLWQSFCYDLLGNAAIKQVHVPRYYPTVSANAFTYGFQIQMQELMAAVGPGYAPLYEEVFGMFALLQQPDAAFAEVSKEVGEVMGYMPELHGDHLLEQLLAMQGPEDFKKVKEGAQQMKIALGRDFRRKMRSTLIITSKEEQMYLSTRIEQVCGALRRGITRMSPEMPLLLLSSLIDHDLAGKGILSFPGTTVRPLTQKKEGFYFPSETKINGESWVQIETGLEYNGMLASVSRLIPPRVFVNSKETKLYSVLLKAHQQALQAPNNGMKKEAYSQKMLSFLEKQFANHPDFGESHRKGQLKASVYPRPLLAVPGTDLSFAPGQAWLIETSLYSTKKLEGMTQKVNFSLRDVVLIQSTENQILSKNLPLSLDKLAVLLPR